jgi:mono/diheme cytochrome c family protein/predicted small secreted protein
MEGPMARALAIATVALCPSILAGCANDTNNGLGPIIPSQSGSSSTSGGGTTTTTTTGGGTESAAATYFKQNVFPAIAGPCNSCHGLGKIGPQFLGKTADEAYTTIKGFAAIIQSPKTSRLITKGQHSGPPLTAAEAKLCTAWLEMELKEDPPENPPPTELTPQQQLEKFGKCMTKKDWDATKVHRLYQMTAKSQNNQVQCQSCHGAGANGTFIDQDSTKMFEATRTIPFIFKFASASLNPDGSFKDIAFSNRWAEKGAEGCPPIGNCHPTFKLDTQLVADINTLYTLTKQHWKDGECGDVPPPENK